MFKLVQLGPHYIGNPSPLHGWQAGGSHPIGMLSCLNYTFSNIDLEATAESFKLLHVQHGKPKIELQ